MRRSKTVNGEITEHVWIGSNIALDITDRWVATGITLDMTDRDVVSYIGNIKSDYGWYVFNAHGDVVQLTDDDGEVVKFYDYDPYGNQTEGAGEPDKNPYRYNGQYWDAVFTLENAEITELEWKKMLFITGISPT